MRPVNLIPSEERLDGPRPMRSGPVPYILLGALVAALLGVTALVTTNNQIAEHEDEIVQIQDEVAAAEAEAQALAPYTQFHQVREERDATIASLADSRFDWERVMRELAFVIPSEVRLTSLSASASPTSTPGGGASVSLRGAIPGPALSLIGCADGHEGVAGFIRAVEDIDGVTRVGVPTSSAGEAGAATDSSSSQGCAEGAASFQMVLAFDAAPVPSPESESTSAVPTSSPESETGTE